MKKILCFIFIVGFSLTAWGAPSNTMSITTPTDATVISASDETTRYNEITVKYNAHSHTDLSSSTSNTWTIGDGAAGNKDYGINDDTANTPALRFNTTTDIWTISNDGSTFSTYNLVSGTVTTDTTQTISAVKTFTEGIIMGGTVPKITVGDGGAEDTQINFDGNTNDYYLGIDDTDSTLQIGHNATLGVSTFVKITNAGQVTKPLQPAFQVGKSGSQDNIATGAAVTITFDTEIKDQGGDFASNTFNAPVTGNYYFCITVSLSDMDTAGSSYNLTIETSNRIYNHFINPLGFAADTRWAFSHSVMADMDAGDTAVARITQGGGTQQTDINSDAIFSGFLAN